MENNYSIRVGKVSISFKKLQRLVHRLADVEGQQAYTLERCQNLTKENRLINSHLEDLENVAEKMDKELAELRKKVKELDSHNNVLTLFNDRSGQRIKNVMNYAATLDLSKKQTREIKRICLDYDKNSNPYLPKKLKKNS